MITDPLTFLHLIKTHCVRCGAEIKKPKDPVERYAIQGNYCAECVRKSSKSTAERRRRNGEMIKLLRKTKW